MASPTATTPARLPAALVGALKAIVGKDCVLTRPGELLPFESDALTVHRAAPAAVVFVRNVDELKRVVAQLRDAHVAFVPRGAGTGLSGGALAEGAVVIELSRMNRIVWIDAENRRARVQPGVANAQLQEAVSRHGLMYAPDPSSQTVSTLGGNVAENSGGPHCLKYGVTTDHILGLTIVSPDGELIELPGPLGPGYDLTGVLVGSEGTLGIASEIEVGLVPRPARVETLLAHFDEIEAAGRGVSAIIAAGILPAALEMIDRETLKAVEASIYAAGFPTDVAASLIVELDGPAAGMAEQADEVERMLKEHGAREVARAENDADRARFWKARKSAFGAMGRLAPELLVQDATVPRSRLPEILREVAEIASKHELTVTNVFHAGDGNLHPNIPFDRRDPSVLERVRRASREIMAACVAVGGTITGEHGVGVDKRDYMPLIYSADDLETMRWVKRAFDQVGLCNPGKVLPDANDDEPVAPGATHNRGIEVKAKSPDAIAATLELALGSDCLADDPEAFVVDGQPAEVAATPGSIEQLSELMKLAHREGWPVLPAGNGGWLDNGRPLRRRPLVVTTRRLDPAVEHQPEDLVATVGAGTTLKALNQTLEGAGQWWPLDPLGPGTLGAAVATAAAGPLAAAFGTPRGMVLGLTAVLADGRVVRAGGQVVKNVAGYDMVKLYTGSWGTLGVIAGCHLRLFARQKADAIQVFSAARPEAVVELATRVAAAEELTPVATELFSPAIVDVLGRGQERWLAAMRWLGQTRAVEEGVRSARELAEDAGCHVDGNGDLWREIGGIEDRLNSQLTVRVDVPTRALMDFLRAATPFVGGEEPAVLASPPLGRLWIFVPGALYSSTSERHWALRLEELRRAAVARGGWTRLEKAPAQLRAIVDPWGDVGAAMRIGERLRSRFDPGDRLKPGFFVRE